MTKCIKKYSLFVGQIKKIQDKQLDQKKLQINTRISYLKNFTNQQISLITANDTQLYYPNTLFLTFSPSNH